MLWLWLWILQNICSTRIFSKKIKTYISALQLQSCLEMSFQTSFSAYYTSRTSLPHTFCLCRGKEQFDNKRISAKARGMSSSVDLSKRCRTTKTCKAHWTTFPNYISEAAGRKLPSNTSDPLDTSATCDELLWSRLQMIWRPGGPVSFWPAAESLRQSPREFFAEGKGPEHMFCFFKVGISEYLISYLSKFLPVTSQCSSHLGGLETASNCFKVKHTGFPQHKDTVAEPRRTAPWSCHKVKEKGWQNPAV